VLGDYTITYIADDKAVPPNYDTVYRIVKVIDTLDPTITLIGSDTIIVGVFSTLTDPGVTISDNYYSGLTATVTDNVDLNKLGTYFRTYCVSDPSGNGPTCVDRVIIVQDITTPSITLIGPDTIYVDVNGHYTELGCSYSDNYWDNTNLILVTSGTVNPFVLGNYVLTYQVVDASGNVSAIVTRIVMVVDQIEPEIELIGPTTVIITRWQNYVEKGVKVYDNYYPASSITVKDNENGTYQNTLWPGLYTYTYSACDPSGNCSKDITRYIYIQESTSSITEDLINDNIKYYPNPASSELNIDIDLPVAMDLKISIFNTLGEKVSEVYSGMIQSDHLTVNTVNLSSGIYYIRVSIDNDQQINKKFMISR
jgi:hypothetical protein